MDDIVEWLNGSSYLKPLSSACKMCAEGSKMVILITGLCPANCFYCPLSIEKQNKDRIFADEWELDSENDVEKLFLETKYIGAKGAGITGGDPLIVWQRTEKYIKILKEKFGKNFNIHLYTSGLKNIDKIKNLVDVGLDEIRFHPDPKEWNDMKKSKIKDAIENSIDFNVKTAIEIPVLPDKVNEIFNLISWADNKKIDYINLNELEFSETNAESLIFKKYDVKDDISSAVFGSEKTAYEILDKCLKSNFKIGIHYCSSSFKDGIQLKNRIFRRAKNIKKPYQEITEDGTLLFGIIESDNDISKIFSFLISAPNLKDKIFLNNKKNRIETSLEIIKNFEKNKDYKCFIIEEYPTADALEVERIPL